MVQPRSLSGKRVKFATVSPTHDQIAATIDGEVEDSLAPTAPQGCSLFQIETISNTLGLTLQTAVTFLIDGYNLMYAVGLLRQGVPPGGLERARSRFLDWLATAAKDRTALLRVVFDARSAPKASAESDHRGVRVLYAYRQTADDLIEELLAAETMPARITVVSNDTRLQTAGHRCGAVVHTCEQFVDWLIDGSPGTPSPPPEPDKPEQTATADEMAAWLTAFSVPKRKRR